VCENVIQAVNKGVLSYFDYDAVAEVRIFKSMIPSKNIWMHFGILRLRDCQKNIRCHWEDQNNKIIALLKLCCLFRCERRESIMASGFISEKVLDEKRRERQDEWEKVRKPEDPKTAPEEPHDSR
jgi:hypothetical protein